MTKDTKQLLVGLILFPIPFLTTKKIVEILKSLGVGDDQISEEILKNFRIKQLKSFLTIICLLTWYIYMS